MTIKIITLSGSTKFKRWFEYWNKAFTLKGYLVISVGVFKHSDKKFKRLKRIDKYLPLLEKIHYKKIDLCDILFVINPRKYIGISTIKEIEYAKTHNKIIRYMIND